MAEDYGQSGVEYRSMPTHQMRGMGRSVFKLLRSAQSGDLGMMNHQPPLPTPGRTALPFKDVKPNWGIPK